MLTTIAAIIIAGLIGYLLYTNYQLKGKTEARSMELTKLNMDLEKAYQIIDSLENARMEEEKAFKESLQLRDSQISQFRTKIKQYEKDLAGINSMPDAVLVDSITNYYKRKYGYNSNR